nr:NAD(P)-dependent alcohol dehydrogenase [Rhodococcus sp. HNM0569]
MVAERPNGPSRLSALQIGPLRADEVLVRIAGVGICHTDLTALAGAVPFPFPAVLGHEGSGVVVEVGSAVTTLTPRDPVVLTFDACGECRTCRSGRPAYCEVFHALNRSGTRADGSTALRDAQGAVHGGWFGQSSFASYAVATERNAVRVPHDVPIELVGPLGCGLLTGAGTVVNVLRPESGSHAAVVGCGAVGLAAVMAFATAGCAHIVAVDTRADRRALAVELGATEAIDPAVTPIKGALRAVGGVDHVVDTVSTAEVLDAAVRGLRAPGTVATVGLRGPRNPVTLDQTLLLGGRTVTGVIEGDARPHDLVPELVEQWRAGRFPFDKMITTFPVDAHADAFDAAATGRVVKPVLTFDQTPKEHS